MNWNSLNLSPETDDPRFWVNLFSDKPDALYSLLYDIYASTEGKLGKGRRRKMNGSLERLWEIVYGEEK